jgi:hypothetical protein
MEAGTPGSPTTLAPLVFSSHASPFPSPFTAIIVIVVASSLSSSEGGAAACFAVVVVLLRFGAFDEASVHRSDDEAALLARFISSLYSRYSRLPLASASRSVPT